MEEEKEVPKEFRTQVRLGALETRQVQGQSTCEGYGGNGGVVLSVVCKGEVDRSIRIKRERLDRIR